MKKSILIIVLIIMGIIFSLKIISKKFTPIILNYAENETRRVANIIVSKAVNSSSLKEIDDDFFIITKEGDTIKSIDFDPIKLNNFVIKIIDRIQTNLKYLESGEINKIDVDNEELLNYDKKNTKKGVFYEIPIGVIFNTPLLSNLGPKIPVRFTLMGEVISSVDNKITNYGINNALIETSLNIKLTEKVLLPISSKIINVEYNIPISLKMIQGTIPNYYFNGIESKNVVVPTK